MRLVRLACVAAMLAGSSAAFASVDYSGTWVLDRAKSDTAAGKRANKKSRGGDAEVRLVVRQSASELTVSRGAAKRARELTFKLDGSESVNHASRKGGEIRSRATWRDSKLVIEGAEKATTKKGEVDRKTVEEWSLSEDGKVLTIKTTRTGRKRDQTATQVFNRQ